MKCLKAVFRCLNLLYRYGKDTWEDDGDGEEDNFEGVSISYIGMESFLAYGLYLIKGKSQSLIGMESAITR